MLLGLIDGNVKRPFHREWLENVDVSNLGLAIGKFALLTKNIASTLPQLQALIILNVNLRKRLPLLYHRGIIHALHPTARVLFLVRAFPRKFS